MARIQILELPTIYRETGEDETPFVLVVDQYAPQRYILGPDQPEPVDQFEHIAERIGARAVLVFEETIDIPANSITVEDGNTAGVVRINVEPDLDDFRQQVESAVTEASSKLSAALHERKPAPQPAPPPDTTP